MSALLYTAPVLLGAGALGLERVLRRRDRHRFPPPGRLIQVGGNALHARVLGQGDVVIVLEADAGAWSAGWDQLPERLSEQGMVVAYDRAGLGWSDPGPGPRTAETQARELHGLLRELAPERPVLLVAHGAGARTAMSFASRYPFELAGVVIVDGEHPSLGVELAAEGIPSPKVSPLTLRCLDIGGRLGLLRLLGFTPAAPAELPASTLAALGALTPSSLATIRAEERAEDGAEGGHGAGAAQIDVPARVLIATESLPRDGTPGDFPREAYNRAWTRSSARLAKRFPRAEVGELEDDHFFHVRRPQVVEEAVRELLAARQG